MDVYATVRIRLNNWCDPEDLLPGESLVQVTQELLRDESMLDDVGEFEVLEAYFIHKLIPIETQPNGRTDWHV